MCCIGWGLGGPEASERVGEVKLCPRARVKLSLCSDQYVLAEEPSGVLLKRTERGGER